MIDLDWSAVSAQGVSWLLTYALHSTLLLGAVWMVTQWWPLTLGVRDTLWKVAMIGGVVTATVQALVGPVLFVSAVNLGHGHEPVPAAAITETVAIVPLPPAAEAEVFQLPLAAEDVPPVLAPDVASSAVQPFEGPALALPSPGARVPWTVWVLVIWLTGAVIGVMRVAVARRRLIALIGERRPVNRADVVGMVDAFRKLGGRRRPIALTSSATLASPVALRSEICVPERAFGALSPSHLRAMLAHETAHVLRGDPTWLLGSLLIQRVFFFQPLNVLGRAGIERVSEYLCDDWTVMHAGRKHVIAECLAEVARWVMQTRRLVALPSFTDDGSHLVRRVERILAPGERDSGLRSGLRPLGAALALLPVALGVPGVQWAPRPEPLPTPAHAATVEEVATVADRVDDVIPARLPDEAAVRRVSRGSSVKLRTSGIRPDPMAIPAAAAPPVITQDTVNPRIVRSLVNTLRDEDAAVRREAAVALGELRAPAAVSALTEALGDGSGAVRATAAWALGRIGDSTSIDPLVTTLRDDSSGVRWRAAEAIGRIVSRHEKTGVPNPNALRGATIAMLGDESSRLRAFGIRLALRLELRSVIPEIANMLNHESSDVRANAVTALGRFRDESSLGALTRALGDSVPEVRQRAVSAVARLGAAGVPALIRSLGDTDHEVRERAANALGQLDDASAVPPLIALTSDPQADVRAVAVRALRRLEDPRAFTAYTARLDDASETVRESAVKGLGETKDVRAVDPLMRALSDADPDVREAAVRGLAGLKDPRAVDPITIALRDPAPDVRQYAARTLGGLGDTRAVPALIAAAGDDVADVRESVLRALMELRDPRAKEAFTNALRDPAEDVREYAVRGLIALKALDRIPQLAAVAATDDESSVRVYAVRGLAALGTADAVDPLISVLDDPTPRVRAIAADALGKMGDIRAVDPLINLLEDDDSAVRRTAVRALARLRGQR